jgi:hypothetical protein
VIAKPGPTAAFITTLEEEPAMPNDPRTLAAVAVIRIRCVFRWNVITDSGGR